MTADKDFVWGASTSAYQIEGATTIDGRGIGVCDTDTKRAGGDTGDVACDHYNRWPEDVALMGQLGLQAYRFSVSWPRLLPRGMGPINEKGLDFYDRLIDGLLAAGIDPWLCLYHGDLPQALENLGGWTNRDSVGWFADFAVLVARRYGDRVKHFIPFNEPSVTTLFKYGFDRPSPDVTNHTMTLKAIHNINLAHGAAADVVRALVPGVSIGCIHARQPVVPEKDDDDGRKAVTFMNEHWNLVFPDAQVLGRYPPMLGELLEPYMRPGDMAKICRPLDWFGINYYCPLYTRYAPWCNWGIGLGDAPPDLPRSGMGWAIQPDGLREELLRIHRSYRLPIIITENGYPSITDAPDADGAVVDPERIAYLDSHVKAMRQAMAEGADVRGYFVWSLLDNFEWGYGYAQRFGIIHVDFASQKRTPKSSALWYRDLIRAARS